MTAVCALWDRLACGRVAVSAVGLGGTERLVLAPGALGRARDLVGSSHAKGSR